ncbi:MAG: histidine phosphatase family protein [Gordonia sp. (in: high G+C Gram-positive bacteria)]|uniref:histidine phosphatase family protein n=1 Tax=Gordonia sp. (in: high G+C Gram-positive bacteria) TaxID=84139 RepID=UPI0039E3EABD
MRNKLPDLVAILFAAVLAVVLTACGGGSDPAPESSTTSASAAADDDMTLTLVRHGQSAGNSSGVIITTVPGPDLTDLGREQSKTAAAAFKDRDFDGVYASPMVRTQQTAEPTAADLRMKTVVVDGIQEIPAGDYEGTPEADAAKTYLVAPIKWTEGDLSARMPGAESGEEFQKRVNGAIAKIRDAGSRKPVVFSHSGTITTWTLMNVKDKKGRALPADLLKNTGYVVVKGSLEKGWTLQEWHTAPAGEK